MAESTPLEDPETGKQSSHCRYFKMKALSTSKSDDIENVVSENIDEKAIVLSTYSSSPHLALNALKQVA